MSTEMKAFGTKVFVTHLNQYSFTNPFTWTGDRLDTRQG